MNAVAERAVSASRSALRPFSVGAPVTDRDGTPTRLCRSLRAPFWVCVDGIVVADFGDDEAAAEALYAPLVHAHRVASGNLQPIFLGA
jgi:hypothetical protein